MASPTRPDGLQVVPSKEPGNINWRRGISVMHRRTNPMSFLGVFDDPIIDPNCTRRVPSATPLQWQAAEALAERAESNVDAACPLTFPGNQRKSNAKSPPLSWRRPLRR